MKKARSKKQDRKFFASTIGMIAKHENMKKSTMVRCEFYEFDDKVELHAVSGENLERIKCVPTVVISVDEYNERDFDYYNDTVEFNWAMSKLGFIGYND